MPKCPYNNKGICDLGIANKCKIMDCRINISTFIILKAIKQLKESVKNE